MMQAFKPSPNVFCVLPLEFQQPQDIKKAFLVKMLTLSAPLIAFALSRLVISVSRVFVSVCFLILANPFREQILVMIILGDVKTLLLLAAYLDGGILVGPNEKVNLVSEIIYSDGPSYDARINLPKCNINGHCLRNLQQTLSTL